MQNDCNQKVINIYFIGSQFVCLFANKLEPPCLATPKKIKKFL